MKQHPRSPKDFDIPAKHLSEAFDYKTPKARDEAEIARRRTARPNQLILEQEREGYKAAAYILRYISDPASIDFATRHLAAAAFNTSWYLIGRGAEITQNRMRRRVKMLQAAERPDEFEPEALLNRAAERMAGCAALAGRLITAIENRRAGKMQLQTQLGRDIGSIAVHLSSVRVAERYQNREFPEYYKELQSEIRVEALSDWQLSEDLGRIIGASPSIAQLNYGRSKFVTYWIEKAPQEASVVMDMATS